MLPEAIYALACRSIFMRRIPVAAAAAATGLVVSAVVANGLAGASPSANPGSLSGLSPAEVAADHVSAAAIAQSLRQRSPASSGEATPSAASMPTGDAVPGPRPGTLEVRSAGQDLICAAPANPFQGASYRTVFARP